MVGSTVGRLAVEKNIEAFLKLDLPGTKLVVGDGPARAQLVKAFPDAVFLGSRQGEDLAKIYASADVFVFPSRTDTFGLVLLEALASGVPVGVLDEDLRLACLGALDLSRQNCRNFALELTWQASTRAFLNLVAQTTQAARPVAGAA